MHLAVGQPSQSPDCQGNVTEAARAMNSHWVTARAGHWRQNFQVIGYTVPCPTRWLLDDMCLLPLGLLSMNFHGKKRQGTWSHIFEACTLCLVFMVHLVRLAWRADCLCVHPALCSAELCQSVVSTQQVTKCLAVVVRL